MAIQKIISSLLTASQAPLDAKVFIKTKAELQDLGDLNYKAFIYYEDMVVSVIEDHTAYIWREEKTTGEIGGLLPSSYTYPPDSISNNIDYSNRVFNFFIKTIDIPQVEGLKTKLDFIEGKRASDNIKISGANEIDLSSLNTTNKSNIIAAINEIVANKAALKSKIDVNELGVASNKDEIDKNVKTITALKNKNITGVQAYTRLSDLPDPGVSTTSYKVANDPTTSNNGYYTWNGTDYVKDTELVDQFIDVNNTSQAVSGRAVFDYSSFNTEIKSVVVNGDYNSKDSPSMLGDLVFKGISDIPSPGNSLTTLGLTKGMKLPAGSAASMLLQSQPGMLMPKFEQYVKWEYYIKVNAGNYAPSPGKMKLILYETGGGQYVNTTSAVATRIGDGVYKVDGFVKIDKLGDTFTSLELENVWDGPGGTADDIYFTGIKMAYYDTPYFTIKNSFTDIEKTLTVVEDDIVVLKEDVKLKIPSIVEGGNFPEYIGHNITNRFSTFKYIKTNNTFLNNIGCYDALTVTTTSGNVSYAIEFNNLEYFLSGQSPDKYLKSRLYVHSPVKPNYSKTGFLAEVNKDGVFNGIYKYANVPGSGVTLKKIDNNLYLLETNFQFRPDIDKDIKDVEWRIYFDEGDPRIYTETYVTGFSVGWADSQKEIVYNDWDPKQYITAGEFTEFKDEIKELGNNLQHNLSAVSRFNLAYERKDVDQWNQLNVTVVGDTIFSQQIDNNIISKTLDTNGGTGIGIATGHFPPNMWTQNVAYKLLETLQFKDADVKYFNHTASEVTKPSGTWIDNFPLGVDRLRITSSTSDDAAIIFDMPLGDTFCKYIFTSYGDIDVTSSNMRIDVSDDDGSSYRGPGGFGITESYKPNYDENEYTLPSIRYKFGNIIFKGFDPNKKYKIKVSKYPGETKPLSCWGFESWSKPRINVIVAAEGDSTAGDQLTHWERFYSEMYNSKLIVYNTPYINDLGSSIITQDSDIEPALQTYELNNRLVFNRCRTLGIDVVVMITHDNSLFHVPPKPYTYENGLTIIRNLIAQTGFAVLDVNRWIRVKKAIDYLYNYVNLNDRGIEIYSTLLKELFAIPYADRYATIKTASTPSKLYGTSTGPNYTYFEYEFPETPIVRVYNNNSITVTDIDKKGYRALGTGDYDYEIFLKN